MELGFLIHFTASSVTTTILYKFLPSFVFYASWPGMFSYRFPDKDFSRQLAILPVFLKKQVYKIMFQNLNGNVLVV